MENNIAYKVVGKKHNFGSNLSMYLSSNSMGVKKFEKWKEKNKKLWNIIKKYYPVYTRGTIVKAPRKSQGILCFKSLEDARKFKWYFKYTTDLKVLKVRGIGKKKDVTELVVRYSNSPLSNIITDKLLPSRWSNIVGFSRVEIL